MQRRMLGLIGGCFVALGAMGVAEAAVVVTKKGRVFVGRVKGEEDVTDQAITLHWPYPKGRAPEGVGKRASFRFEKHHLRWWDLEADDLTIDYWKSHGEEPIEAGFAPPPELAAAEGGLNPSVAAMIDVAKSARPQELAKAKESGAGCEFQPPEGWDRFETDGVCGYVASREVVDGFAARIHLVSVHRPVGSISARAERFTELLSRFDARDGVEIRSKPETEPLGAHLSEVRLRTATRVGDKVVVAQRYLVFSRERVVIVSCYAAERDFSRRLEFFKAFRRTLTLLDG